LAGSRRAASVVVTAAGTVVAQGIIKSLRLASSADRSRIRYTITATDMSPEAAGLYRSDRGVLVPGARSRRYVDAMVAVCRQAGAEALFVGSDEELLPLAAAAERIERESGAVVVVGQKGLVSLGQDKWRTFRFLKKNALPCAESALPGEMDGFLREFGFPVVVKPREGHGSLGFQVAGSREEVEGACATIERRGWRPMLQEHLGDADQEYTSGVTLDRSGATVLSSISMRRRLKGGQTFRAFVDDYPEVRRSAERTARALGARGPVNVQVRISGGEPRAFEINPRFSASCPIRAVAGVNEPDVVFRNWVRGEKVAAVGCEKLVCLRFLDEVYVPYPTYEAMASRGEVSQGGSSVVGYF